MWGNLLIRDNFCENNPQRHRCYVFYILSKMFYIIFSNILTLFLLCFMQKSSSGWEMPKVERDSPQVAWKKSS